MLIVKQINEIENLKKLKGYSQNLPSPLWLLVINILFYKINNRIKFILNF